MDETRVKDDVAENNRSANDDSVRANNEVVPLPLEMENQPIETKYMKGYKLYMLTVGIWIALFLSTLETTIVSTSLVAISDSLSGFELRNWIVTSYFLTYTGFLMIYAKLSSIFGQKTMFLLALVIFTLFSIACGVCNSMRTIIILRAFQGMGGSGIYSMALVIATDIISPAEYGKYVGIVSSVFALASIMGPLVGGAISSHSTWRWVFLLNGPPGALAILLVAIFLPSSKANDVHNTARLRAKFSRKALRRVDILGVILLLAASVLLVFALESGGTRYTWNSAVMISTLALSGISWAAFIFWELHVERTKASQEPVFPMKFVKIRVVASLMFVTFFVGFPFVTILFIIPQKAQLVNGISPVRAGLTLLPLLLTSPAATALSGSVIQVIGVGLTTNVPLVTEGVSPKQFGYEAIMGVGFGMTLSTVLTLSQFVVNKEYAGIVMGALTQIRVLGGTVGLAICSALLSNHLKMSLANVITPQEFRNISDNLAAIHSLDENQLLAVRHAFAVGYQKQIQLLTGFSGAALLASLFLFSRTPITVKNAEMIKSSLEL